MSHDDDIYYNGMKVLKKHFRVFVYGIDDKKKLVNSWQEYQSCLGSGVWFKSQDDIVKQDPIEIDSLLLKNKKSRVKNDS